MINSMTPPDGDEDGRHIHGGEANHHQLGEEKNDGTELKGSSLEGICANSLSLYLGIPHMDFYGWSDFMKIMLPDPESAPHFSTMLDCRGDVVLNLKFAEFLAKRGPRNLFGSIARIVIDEELYGPRSKFPPSHARRMLQFFEALVYDDQLDPPLLHQFLEVESPFDCWLKEQIERFQPVYERDYSANTFDDLIDEAAYHKSSLLEQFQVHLFDVWLDKNFATKVAMASPTRRGALLRMLLEGTR